MTAHTRSSHPRSQLLRRVQANYPAEAKQAEAMMAKLRQDRRVTRPGRPATGRKPLISLRVPADLLAWFKAQGQGYQTRMIEALEHERQRVARRA